MAAGRDDGARCREICALAAGCGRVSHGEGSVHELDHRNREVERFVQTATDQTIHDDRFIELRAQVTQGGVVLGGGVRPGPGKGVAHDGTVCGVGHGAVVAEAAADASEIRLD
ncbi:MAG: hypothetical protein DI613_18140, partial [Kocuria rhizophila]